MTMMSEHDDWVTIRVAGPVPLGMAAALMELVGSAWPEAVVDARANLLGDALTMRVPPGSAKRVTKKAAAALREEAAVMDAETPGAAVTGMDDGWLSVSTTEELQLFLGEVAHRIFGGQDETPANYLEWTVTTPDKDVSYVVSVAKSKGQTPHALRTAAEEKVADLTAEVARLAAEIEANKPAT